MQQLPLQLLPKEGCTFNSFFAGSNHLVFEILKNIFDAGSEQQIYIWAAQGRGKSHLLQAACHAASARGLTASYLPLAQMPGVTPDILEGIEQLDLVAIDDLDSILGQADWEHALFALINLSRTSEVRLLFAAEKNPAVQDLILPDLRSRLTWGPVFNLQALTDDEKQAALQWRAQARGLELPDNVANYLIEHCPRDLFALFESIDTLDQASLAQQRRLTIPFVKQVLLMEAN